MKVLHFIDKNVRTAGNDVFDYLPALLRGLSAETDACVIIPPHVDIVAGCGSLRVCAYRSSFFYAVKTLRLFARWLNETKPDIVHIHGCGSILSALFMKRCERMDIPVIITTGKQFEPWRVRRHFWLRRFHKLLLFQHCMLKRACALHMLGSQELETLSRLSWHPLLRSRHKWNGNLAVIHNFNRAPSMTSSDMADLTLALYSKVADSNPFMLMSDADKACEDIFLEKGSLHDDAPLAFTDEEKKQLSAMNDAAMRYIMLHATDERIYKYVMIGALKCKARIPAFNPSAVERFKSHYRPALADSHPAEPETSASRIDFDETLTSAERDICKQLMLVLRKYHGGMLRRIDFAQLSQLLRYTDYDERLLRHALLRLRIAKQSARLFQLLSEHYALTEGFMPIQPVDDRRTKRMRRNIRRLGIE